MTWKQRSVLAVVPARGGSKGIPRKNLAQIGGRSLVAHVAEVIAALDWLDYAVVSTDDEDIAAEARAHGLEAPFMRPAALAGDHAPAADTWQHAWLQSEAVRGMRFDVSVLLEPTSPLRRPDDVERAVDLLVERDCSSVVTVSRTPGHFTPERTLWVAADGVLHPYLADGLTYTARQMISPYYHRNGLAYAVTRAGLVDAGRIIHADSVALPIERPVVNIDELLDLEWAEFLLQRQAARP